MSGEPMSQPSSFFSLAAFWIAHDKMGSNRPKHRVGFELKHRRNPGFGGWRVFLEGRFRVLLFVLPFISWA